MEHSTAGLRLSATDLANHLACRHLTQLNLRVAHGELAKPYRSDPKLDTLRTLGDQHEKRYVESLRADGKSVAEIEVDSTSTRNDRTLAAMRAGADVIIQPSLEGSPWRGRADLLVRVDLASDLGDWSYEAVDTKLARETRGGTTLQLCLYSDLVGRLQGQTPRNAHVVKPGDPYEIETFWLSDYWAYFRRVQQRLLDEVGSPPKTYPDPVPFCDICQWSVECRRRRKEDDHLSLVAGMSKSQIAEVTDRGLTTLREFANATDLGSTPLKRGSLDSLKITQEQAKIQLKGRSTGRPEVEFLVLEPGMGFNRLPEPDAGDLFFDLEGERLSLRGGTEYLFGFAFYRDGIQIESRWSLTTDDEKATFEAFIDLVLDRWHAHPGMHIYHYAPYEDAALKGLATKHATREIDLDRILRSKRLVDLHAIVKQSLRASVERYSIKDLEPFYGFDRETDLSTANRALARVESALALEVPTLISDDDREIVTSYNRDDCLSTAALRDWLERLRADRLGEGDPIERPTDDPGDGSEQVQAIEERLDRVATQLTSGLPTEEPGEPRHPHRLLANLLPYYRREEKCVWWEYFNLQGLETEELLHHQEAIAGLAYVRDGEGRCQVYRYEPQETAIDTGDSLVAVGGENLGKVESNERQAGELIIKKSARTFGIHPSAVFRFTRVPTDILTDSILGFGELVAEASEPLKNARYDLLCRKPPRLSSLKLPLKLGSHSEAVRRLVSDLDHGVLPIQGPPGTGKTHITAEAIIQLASDGKRVGITAVSHQVILNVLAKVAELSEGKTPVAHCNSRPMEMPPGVDRVQNMDAVARALDEGTVVGGTAWLWSKPDLEEAPLDVLFVDEAGQASLAMTIAAARSADNLVLVGDPQQLDQPQKGSHPDGSDASSLKHLLGENATVPCDRGLLLDQTWRLHPDVCRFTSELYYDGKLTSREGLENQAIQGVSELSGAGLAYLPIEHEGNQNESLEEIVAVREVFDALLDGRHNWVPSARDAPEPLTVEQILVVAPYNRQVNSLMRALPAGARVGTVDKFQGQQAPLVIYSMTTSSAQEAPRGLEFLFSPNRLNVATSRAQARVVLIGSPRLLEADCQSPAQMRLVNGLCRYVEIAVEDNSR